MDLQRSVIAFVFGAAVHGVTVLTRRKFQFGDTIANEMISPKWKTGRLLRLTLFVG